MQFESFSEFIHMGGHGAYIWSAYGITLVTVMGLIIAPMNKKKRFFVDQMMKRRREQASTKSVSD